MKMVILILRLIGAAAAGVLLAFFVIPMTSRIINVGSFAGVALCLWVICLCVPPLHAAIKALCFRAAFGKVVFYVVNIAFCVFALYGAVVTGAMVWAANTAPSENSTAVVLGAQVKPWGPSKILNGRIKAAETYLDAVVKAKAVLSGGQGSDEVTSEAQCMYNEMTAYGIEADRLYKEDKSSNTTENLTYSFKIINENNLNDDIAIVTDGFHQLRARIICRQLGITSNVGAVSASTRLLYVPVYTVREWFALPYQLIFR